MKYISVREQLINSIGDLQEDAVREVVLKRIASGDDPLHIIDDCQRGMKLVGERYEQGKYYIAGLIMAGEIFRQVTEILQPVLKDQSVAEIKGSVLLGTVEGDIHDLGKNILSILLTCHGFKVQDLGVDVPPGKFVERVKELQPDIVGLSGLLTHSYSKMKQIIELVKNETKSLSLDIPVVIGGSQINEQVARVVGTKFWCNDAVKGIRICLNLMNKNKVEK
ncbi:cobalamin B12-binding domain-containing protein [Desulfitibacter alkalitolerans]|uniref:cobalamin B12-binding domain-containing protein n=1 Tax=Desulfitibacter alkalitolerans TaxID=264641 RepID=UPI0006851228|nr:cobalamin-dependent protein [Desulfitibacter alkalitolerans]